MHNSAHDTVPERSDPSESDIDACHWKTIYWNHFPFHELMSRQLQHTWSTKEKQGTINKWMKSTLHQTEKWKT